MSGGGLDSRMLSATFSFPFTAIGALSAGDASDSGGIVATGFLIDPTHVLTAGHAVYDALGLGFYRNVTFAAGQQGTSQPFGVAHVVAARTTFDFVEGGGFQIDESDDYGLLTLDQPIGNEAGWLKLHPLNMPPEGLPVAPVNTLSVTTAGYAGDLDPAGTHQYQSSGTVISLSFDVATNLDANHGQSGSPIWIDDGGVPGVIAVLHGLPTNANLVLTSPSSLQYPIIGAPIQAKTIADIQRWEAQDAGSYAKNPAGAYLDGIDVDYYLQQNPDVALAKVDPVQHYLSFGWQEGRLANPLFDESWYLAKYSDVNLAQVDPLLHYETIGWQEGRDPSPVFSTADYLSKNPDVKAAGINPLDHYLLFGLAEHRMV